MYYKKNNYRMILQKTKCESIPNSQLGLILMYLRKYSSEFNRYLKYFYKSSTNPYDVLLSLCSQCVQTSNLMNFIFSNPEEYIIFDDNKFIPLSPKITITKILESNTLKVSGLTGTDIESLLEQIVTLFDNINGINIAVRIPHSSGFPGHRFNIIKEPGNDKPIYITQSSIYEYTLKLWVTNDKTDIKEFLRIYFNMILDDSPIFTETDIKMLKQVSGSPSTEYRGKNFVGLEKPKFLQFGISNFTFKTIDRRFNTLQYECKKNLLFYENILKILNSDNLFNVINIISKSISRILIDSNHFYKKACSTIVCEESNQRIKLLYAIGYEFKRVLNKSPFKPQNSQKRMLLLKSKFLNESQELNTTEIMERLATKHKDLIKDIVEIYVSDLYKFNDILNYVERETNIGTTDYVKGDFIYLQNIPICKGKLPYATSKTRISNCIQPGMQQVSTDVKSQCRQSHFGTRQQLQSEISYTKLKQLQKQISKK